MDIYLILVIVLFSLAISDLVVGVSNDAVNFLNSAIGSKAAPLKVILIMASIGILVGVTFSGGLMEVARKGIFHPGAFYFSDIMIIFLAVMIADIILLDLFNTFGFPTSTTVSIVFELLGAAVAISIIKLTSESGGHLSDYINSGKALAIISGILLSIVVSFTVGSFVQFFVRWIFSFDYSRTIKYFGALWGAIGITSITYFILIKGAKGSTIISTETLEMIRTNTIFIVLISFVFWTLVLQSLLWLTKVNILKIIVLIGTFALAMAFAGNDLVNFIGVPLAGFSSYSIFSESQGAYADSFLMTELAGKVSTHTYLLVFAGLVMTITLWRSKKARSVTETEINLSRQGFGYERFGSSEISRNVVRSSISIGSWLQQITPDFILSSIERRFSPLKKEQTKDDKPSFDLLRASVNLTVASVLISFATSLKLPLSTTYVTFMVAMGTSFADGAWGRESAVYRIAGVTSVVGGWFLTAFGAFASAFLLAIIFYYGGTFVIFLMIGIGIWFVIKTHRIHRKRLMAKKSDILVQKEELIDSDVLTQSLTDVQETLGSISTIYNDIMRGFIDEKLKKLKKNVKASFKLNKEVKNLKNNVHLTISNLREDLVETGHYYVQVLDHLREMTRCLIFIADPVYEHTANGHKGLNKEQIEEFRNLSKEVVKVIEEISSVTKERQFHQIDEIRGVQEYILEEINKLNKKQLKRIKKGEIGTRNGMICLTLLSETKNLILNSINLVKSERDFVIYNRVY